MTELNGELWLNIIKTEMRPCPCPRSLQHLHNANSKTRRGQQSFSIHIISGVGAALSNAETHRPIP